MQVHELKQNVIDTIDSMASDLIKVSQDIHARPELAFEEFFAADRLCTMVEDNGLKVTRNAYGLETAFVSSFGDPNKHDCEVAIISEYDALPGIGHACGHNIIAAAGLGATLALSKLNSKLPGRVRYLGTPAEEKGGGKEYMAQKGAFDGLDAAMMVHPAGVNLLTMPSLAMTEVNVIYHGKNAHAAGSPHEGINSLDALVSAYQSLAQLRQHIKSSERIHGIFTDAGQAPNIVPDRAAGTFYVRASDGTELADLKKRVENCLQAGALATGCTAEINWAKVDYLEIKNSWDMAEAYRQNAKALGREFFPIDMIPTNAAGSTDMGNVSHRVPSIHPMIACAPPEVVIHNPEFAHYAGSESGDLAVLDGAKSMAMTALDFMTDAELRQKTKDSFAETGDASKKSVESAWRENGIAHLGGCGCS